MLVLHSMSVVMALAIRLGSPPGVRPFLPLCPTRSKSASVLTPLYSPHRHPGLIAGGTVVVFILGLNECAPSSSTPYPVCWLVVDT